MSLVSSPSAASLASVPGTPPVACGRAAETAALERSLDALGRTFHAPFVLVRVAEGEPTREPTDGPARWDRAAYDLATRVARSGRACVSCDLEPLMLVAVPVPGTPSGTAVAVGRVVCRSPRDEADVAHLAALWNADPRDVLAWAARKRVLEPTAALELAELVADKLAAERRADRLEGEVAALSERIAATFEEISLIYRITGQLRLAGTPDVLGPSTLEGLAEVVPADAVVLRMSVRLDADLMASDGPRAPVLHAYGESPLGVDEFQQLLQHLDLLDHPRPVVRNHLARDSRWPFPSVRQLILVPLAEGDRVFGWLAAFNHRDGAEFGTVEANLFSSVATILGIHTGNIDLYRQQAELLTGVVRALSSAIDAKDPYTKGHSDRVARVAVRLAQELGCDPETIKTIYLAGLLHDVGKIGINDDVLRKPGRLTDAEYQHIQTHVEIGYKILKDLRRMGHVLPVVLHHHEAWDGRGYPFGLSGSNIPYLARIVAVADAFDAMSSDRPYRRGMDDDKLDAIIRAGAGQQWDPTVVEAFFRVREEIRAISKDENNPLDISSLQWS